MDHEMSSLLGSLVLLSMSQQDKSDNALSERNKKLKGSTARDCIPINASLQSEHQRRLHLSSSEVQIGSIIIRKRRVFLRVSGAQRDTGAGRKSNYGAGASLLLCSRLGG